MQTPRLGPSSFAPSLNAQNRGFAGVDRKQRPEIELASVPFFGPVVRRGLADQVAGGLIKDRLLRLLGNFAEAQKEARTERATEMGGRVEHLRRELESLEVKDVASAEALFKTVGSLSKELETIIDDVDYLSFRTVSSLSQLKALNLALRSSKLLWQSIRVGDAVRDPLILPRAHHLVESTERIAKLAAEGRDVSAELRTLEASYAELAKDIEAKAGDSGLVHGSTALTVSRRIWEYRSAIEAAALEREGKLGGTMSNPELLAWVRENGLPEEVIARLLEEDVAKNLFAFANAEGAVRGDAAERMQARARELGEKIRDLDVTKLGNVDHLESLTRELSGQLDVLLAEAEKIAKPIDKPVRKLRAANDALRAMRGLFTAMRLARALEDPQFRGHAEQLAEQVRGLKDTSDQERYDERLATLENGLFAFEGELKDRLKLDTIPFADRSTQAVGKARQVARFREALHHAAQPEVMAALRALSTLDMEPAERAAIYKKAQQKPLLDAVVSVIVASNELELGFSFADLGRGINDALRVGGSSKDELNPYLAKSPLAFLGQANFERAFGQVDNFLKTADTPEGRKHIDNGLNVFRAMLRVEAGQVERVAVHVPEEDRARVAAAGAEWVAKSSIALLHFLGQELADPGGEAMADVLDAAIATTERRLDDMLDKNPRELERDDLDALKSSVRSSAGAQAWSSGQSQIFGALSNLSDRDLSASPLQELEAVNAKLVDALQSVETTEDSRDAMRAIVRDLGASARMLVHLVHLFGAASNERMEEDARANAIRSSVERMGPLFVKMMQTLVNMQSLLSRVAPNADQKSVDPLFSALKKLQDECRPLTWDVAKAEIESSLGMPVEKAFVWIDPEPLKAGSIGQTHRAKIEVVEDGKTRIADVVVKVLRPGIDENFAETIRVTQLTLSIFRELLRLDADGAIFGKVKERAEATLPMLERALESFIESFRIETSFAQEAENMRRFSKMLGADRHVAVPKLYESHTRGNVLVMQEMRGFKLSKWLERYTWSKDQVPLVGERGPFTGGTEAKARVSAWLEETLGVRAKDATLLKQNHGWFLVRAGGHDVWARESTGEIQPKTALAAPDARVLEKRLEKWAKKRFGLEVERIHVEPHREKKYLRTREGMRATITFKDPKQPPATVFVRNKDASIHARSEIPDLTERGIAALRDRLGSTFVNQLLAGLLHGDPHEGNFFVMPDGKTVALIDFGLAIELGLHDTIGPLKLIAGAIMKEPKQMAKALASMAMEDPNASHIDHQRVVVKLTRACRTLLDEVEAEMATRRGDLTIPPASLFAQRVMLSLERSLDVMLNRVGLAPKAHMLQSLKATFSMGGNLAAIEAEIDDRRRGKSALRIMRDFSLYQAIAPFFGRRMHDKKVAHIEKMTALDVRALSAGPSRRAS